MQRIAGVVFQGGNRMIIDVKNGIFTGSFQGTLTEKRKKNSGTKKSLGYNPRELSGMLMGAKNAQSASMVQARARNKQAVLQRTLASGQYNEKQVRTAIAHAKRIAECARIKVKNFKEEEQMRQQNERKMEEKMLQQELLRQKRKHRHSEDGRIQAADRKYYEEQMRNTGEGVSVTSESVILELSGGQMQTPVSAGICAQAASVDVTI